MLDPGSEESVRHGPQLADLPGEDTRRQDKLRPPHHGCPREAEAAVNLGTLQARSSCKEGSPLGPGQHTGPGVLRRL